MSGEGALPQSARLDAICAHLAQHYRIGIEEICTLFGVTRDTARRDVVRLDADGRALRVRGGAVLPPQRRQVQQYALRTGAAAARQAIGAAAAALLRDGDRVLFDTSTTVLEVARAVTAALAVVTNSIDVAEAFGQRDGIELHVLGGRFNAWQRSLEGAQTLQGVARFQLDKLVLGVCAIDPQGLTCPSDDEAALKQAMLGQAGQVIAVADASRFGKAFMHRLCRFEGIDVLVTDQPPPAAIGAALAAAGVRVIVAAAGAAACGVASAPSSAPVPT